MTEFLVFRLYGPMAAWGLPAVGELRPVQEYPSRSAVLGLLGACLGIARDDAAGQQALAGGYGLAVRVDAPGSLMDDYHTVQAPRAQRGFSPRTRREEIVQDRAPLETIVTRRGYRVDALAVAALWARPEARWRLDELQSALLRPRFMPYLGRKSCPLALPPCPLLTASETLQQALSEASAAWEKADAEMKPYLSRLPKRRGDCLLAWDDDLDPPPVAADRVTRHRRRDQPGERTRWQFHERLENRALLKSEEAP